MMSNSKIQNAVQASQQKAVTGKTATQNLQGYLKQYKSAFEAALPTMITPERFTRMAMTALTTNPKLADCSPQSFIGACLTAAQLGLEPNTPLGQAYLIPYGKQCQFQVGYKGLIELVYRSEIVKSLTAQIVYENDKFDYALGLNPTLEHVPAMKDRGNAIACYAVIHYTNGGYAFEVMSISDIIDFAKKKSKTYNNGPWQTDFEAMCKKTVIKRLLKYAPLKTELATAAAVDDTVPEVNLSLPVDETNTDTIQYIDVDADTGEVIENKEKQGE